MAHSAVASCQEHYANERKQALTQQIAHAVAQIVLLIEGVVARRVLYVSIQLEDVPHLQHTLRSLHDMFTNNICVPVFP